MAVTDWLRLATEGATTDGRKISDDWINQMANNYDPEKFGARIDLEHIRSYDPESVFKIYGDVLELKAEEQDGKLRLLGKLDVTDDYIELNKKRQKVYTSIEVDPDFSDTGECYLVGLAFTDDPASLGTEMIKFCSKAKSNPLKNRKQRPENYISEAQEMELKFMSDKTNPQKDEAGLLDKVKALFSKQQKEAGEKHDALFSELEETLMLIVNKFTALEEKVSEIETASKKGAEEKAGKEDEGQGEPDTEFAKLKAEFEKLQERFNNEPDPSKQKREKSTGGSELLAEF